MFVKVKQISDDRVGTGVLENGEEIDFRVAKGVNIPEENGRYHFQGGFFSSLNGSTLPRKFFLVEGHENG